MVTANSAEQRGQVGSGEFVAWRNPLGHEGTLALMTSKSLIFAAPGSPEALGNAIREYEQQGKLPDGAREIDTQSIARIRFDKRSTDIAILFESDEQSGILYYDFGNPTARDSFIETFKSEFGNRFSDRTREYTPLTAAVRPLLLGVLIAMSTWAVYVTASSLVSPAGIFLVGGAGLLFSLTRLVQRVAYPPLLRTLRQRA